MRLHFKDVRRAARVAKLVRAELAAHGIQAGLRRVQDIVAVGYGYEGHRELHACAGREPQSPWDEDCSPEVVASRVQRWIGALVDAGLSREQAMATVTALRPSGRRLGGTADPSKATASRKAWPRPVEISLDSASQLVQGCLTEPGIVVGDEYVALPIGSVLVSAGGEPGKGGWDAILDGLADRGLVAGFLHVMADADFACIQAILTKDLEIPGPWEHWERVNGTQARDLVNADPPDFSAGYRHGMAALPGGIIVVDALTLDAPEHEESFKLLREFGYEASRLLIGPAALVRHLHAKGRISALRKVRDIEADTHLHNVLVLAAAKGMPSIYVDVGRFDARVSGREDGVVRQLEEIPAARGHAVCEAAYRLLGMDALSTYDRDRPQFGSSSRRSGQLPPGVAALRIEWTPTPLDGRSMHIRVFPKPAASSGRKHWIGGLTASQGTAFARMVREPVGIVVVSGPPATGKTTTLAEAVRALSMSGGGRRIVCVDPDDAEAFPEATVLYAGAFHDHDEGSGSSPSLTRRVLTSDAETIVIGEVANPSAARLAFEAAMSGRQVWTTIRANGALQSLERMRAYGIELHTLCDHTLVRGLISQRLVRTLCPDCSFGESEAVEAGLVTVEAHGSARELLDRHVGASGMRYASPNGCPSCTGGYAGRCLVAETVVPSRDIMDALRCGNAHEARSQWLRHEGGITMLERAARLVAEGITDVPEVEARVGFLDQVEFGEPKRSSREAA